MDGFGFHPALLADIMVWLKQGSPRDAAFLLFAMGAMAGSLLVPYCRNVVHSAFALLLTLGSVAGLYIMLSADFLAAVQIMVYVGGVLVLILFGILLTGRPVAGREKPVGLVHSVLAAAIAGAACVMLWKIANPAPELAGDLFYGSPAPHASTTGDVAHLLLTTYLLPFEIISVLLIAVLVGAVVISRSSEEL